MVTIITEKLRNQTLDDVESAPVPIPQCSGNTWTFNMGPPCLLSEKDTTCWRLSDLQTWPCKKPPPLSKAETPSIIGHTDSSSKHQKTAHFELESIPNTPPAPPKKRHCRSLSIPGDERSRSRWQPHASSVWRPVGQRSLLNTAKTKNKAKNRNSPSFAPHRPKQCTSPPNLLNPVSMPASVHRSFSKSNSKSDEYSTPPESPIPRPASASSGYSDSFSSLSSPWPDFSLVQGKFEPFRMRSLSMEETHTSPGHQRRRHSSAGFQFPSNPGSMPAIPSCHTSVPSSPRRQHVPRCRSQPCDLHERKCLKRRRDEGRPALDFHKMKETAYGPNSSTAGLFHSRGFLSDQNILRSSTSSRSMANLFTEPPQLVLGLDTIASSPLDSHIGMSLRSSQNGSNNVTPTTAADTRALIISSSAASTLTPGEWDADSRTSDSGCSDGNLIPSDGGAFVDSENSCSCDGETDNTDGQVFDLDLEINTELDLDQIEND